MNINPKDFALSVVSSSDPQLSFEQKAKLYEEAFNFISKRNKEVSASKPQQVNEVKKSIRKMGF